MPPAPVPDGAAAPPDALADWLAIRPLVPWPRETAAPGLPKGGGADSARPPDAHRPTADGIRDLLAERTARDPAGAERALAALDRARADAARGRELRFSLMAEWQRLVLDRHETGFRRLPAFAKRGRERYGLTPQTPALFDRCLAESAAPGLPLPARVARAHLDVLFFHPFDDGNARAALLATAYLLARAGAPLGRAHALRTTRWADDPEGAAGLSHLLALLLTASDPPHHAPSQPGARRLDETVVPRPDD
ncbi:Fic family protein [Streptomyces sp. NPDC050560]|uniref:Fic family protein n=1 Tax=Streptomyces sp. NPDC050560 TaxID=3365630 RepID=UPI00379843D2